MSALGCCLFDRLGLGSCVHRQKACRGLSESEVDNASSSINSDAS